MDSAVTIGAQHAHACVFQPLEQLSAWMAVGIVFARGNDRHLRLDGCEKIVHRRILAAVMAHLQYIGPQLTSAPLRQYFVLGLLLGIARQEHRSISIVET